MRRLDNVMRNGSNDAAAADSHLSTGQLIRALDEELPGMEAAAVEAHLAQCDKCRKAHHKLRLASLEIESMLAGITPAVSQGERERLMEQLEAQEHVRVSSGGHDWARRFGWGMAIAATLAIGVLFIPQQRATRTGHATSLESQAAFEVDGESFVPLPYSNPELPVNTSHIVQMQVPVASLAEAGIVFEPIASEVLRPDDSVLADVLLGMDGQPVGVHVLGGQ